MEFPRYVIEYMTPFHCKRGPSYCDKCASLKSEGQKWCVLKLFHGDEDEYPVARPITEIVIDGNTFFVEFEFVECFNTEAEAKTYLDNLI